MPAGKVIHVILVNYGAHKQTTVRQWLVRHPRWVFHFTPTSCSWLNALETFFAKLTKRRPKRGVFHSLVALQTAINRFVDTHNQNPKPFLWKADPNASRQAGTFRQPCRARAAFPIPPGVLDAVMGLSRSVSGGRLSLRVMM